MQDLFREPELSRASVATPIHQRTRVVSTRTSPPRRRGKRPVYSETVIVA
jgi:hypothetical protein